MEWRSHFKAAFFSAWCDYGFPDPSRYTRAYAKSCGAIKADQALIAAEPETCGPLAAATLREVYTFGVFFGQVAGLLLALPAAEIESRVGWCGRFNLGISLFDHLSDEAGRGEDLLRSPPFDRLWPRRSFASASGRNVKPRSRPEQFLRQLAADVLVELEAEIGPLERRPRADGLWRSLGKMMRAETLITRARLGQNPDVDGLLDAAKTKSAGPFGSMAEWMTLGSNRASVSRKKARDLGQAIGHCYWLVDDARDLWEDLDAGHCNAFLLTASKMDSSLLSSRFDPASEIRLSKILLRPGWVEQMVTPAIARVYEMFRRAPALREAREEAGGLLAASMDRWLH